MRQRMVLAAALLASFSLAACNAHKTSAAAEDETMCKQVKPGTVATVNHYCVIVNDDPVNPDVVREYKGQKVGFCCEGCIKDWNAMSDTQKDAAVKAAEAKGKVAG